MYKNTPFLELYVSTLKIVEQHQCDGYFVIIYGSERIFCKFQIKKPLNLSGLVIWTGIEPVTHSLEGCCSIQLSYQTSNIISLRAAKLKKNTYYKSPALLF
jgi:hypothetical protein